MTICKPQKKNNNNNDKHLQILTQIELNNDKKIWNLKLEKMKKKKNYISLRYLQQLLRDIIS